MQHGGLFVILATLFIVCGTSQGSAEKKKCDQARTVEECYNADFNDECRWQGSQHLGKCIQDPCTKQVFSLGKICQDAKGLVCNYNQKFKLCMHPVFNKEDLKKPAHYQDRCAQSHSPEDCNNLFGCVYEIDHCAFDCSLVGRNVLSAEAVKDSEDTCQSLKAFKKTACKWHSSERGCVNPLIEQLDAE